MSEENKAVVRRFIDEVINKGDLGVIDELVSPSMVDHSAPPGLPSGPEGTKQMLTMFRTAFPDLNGTLPLQDLLAEGDKVAVRYTIRGTHQGDFMGIAATGKQVTIEGIEIDRIEDGKVVEHWESMDMMALMQQLGAVPGS